MVGEKWSIWLAERPVTVNAKNDAVKYGKPFSHPFLILKDAFDATRGEIHGTWGNWPNRGLMGKPGKLLDHFTGVAGSEVTVRFITKVAYPFYPVSGLVAINDNFVPRPSIEKQQIFLGSQRGAMERWHILKEIFPSINENRLPFYRYATRGSGFANCQVLLRAALEKTAVVEAIPELKLAHTGWTAPVKTSINPSL